MILISDKVNYPEYRISGKMAIERAVCFLKSSLVQFVGSPIARSVKLVPLVSPYAFKAYT